MSITCPQCSQVNPSQSMFCVTCGHRLQSTGQTGFVETSPSAPQSFAYPTPGMPPPSQQFSASPPPSQQFSANMPPPQSWPPTAAAPSSFPAQIGTGQGIASLRRAFAGHGKLVFHHSWLLEGKQVQATGIISTILTRLRQRNIAGLGINPERLMERGLLMEERDYLTVSRGVSTVFVYAAPAGQDLYISRATTVLPAISNVRIVLYSLLLLAALFGPAVIGGFTSATLGPTLGPSAASGIASALSATFITPIWLILIGLLIRSFIVWLFEKDFWWFLRPNVLNDFQLDDIALMEHVTDDVVHDAVKELGLDASKITPPTEGYRPKQKIRAF